MASILETVAYLVLGGIIGWWVKRRFFAPAFAESDMARLSREWRDHLDAHAKSLDGSVALTPAPVRIDYASVLQPGQMVAPRVYNLSDIDAP